MLHQTLDTWAASQPGALFGATTAQRLTYAEARRDAIRLARAIRASGLREGDRIAVLAKNRLEYVLLFYAASWAGVTLVPLNTRLASEEWGYILTDAAPELIFVDGLFVDELQRVAPRAGRYVVLDAVDGRPSSWTPMDEWIETQQPDARLPGADADRDLLQLYTSATTGRPKGAVLTQRAVCANIAQVGEAIRLQPGDRSLVVTPLFHAAAVPSTLAPLSRGASVIVVSDFRPDDILRVLESERIAYAVLVPSMLQACLLQSATEYRYDALKLIYYGSSPIAETTLRAAMAQFGCDFMQSYGMTEATQAVTFLTPEDHRRALAGNPELLMSAGLPAPLTEVAVVDPLDQPVPPGRLGEVVVRGPQVMRCYWNQPQATADTLRNGWLHTGDIGTLDETGYLTIRDRLKDMIVSGGENVYPRAIEDVIMRHPGVADVAVIGVPHPHWGETVKAIVVTRGGAVVPEDELLAECRAHLGGFEVPRSVDFVEALPRNAAGKVLKRVLRDHYWVGVKRDVAGA